MSFLTFFSRNPGLARVSAKKICGNTEGPHHRAAKTSLMLTETKSGRLVLILFFVLVGYAIARSLYVGSVMGIILGIVSLGACVYFIYLMLSIKAKMHGEEQKVI